MFEKTIQHFVIFSKRDAQYQCRFAAEHSARRQKQFLNRYNTITHRVSGSIRLNCKRIIMIGSHHHPPSLELRVFGAPRLLLDQRDVPFRRRQPLAIMAVLALSERSVTRDELTYLLWPDSPQTVGRQRLRRSLSQLRQSVGPLADRLLTGEAGIGSSVIRFDASMCRVDAREFVRLSAQARTLPDPDGLRAAEQASRLYAGPLLSGLEPGESPEFEHWLCQQRERFERMHLMSGNVWLMAMLARVMLSVRLLRLNMRSFSIRSLKCCTARRYGSTQKPVVAVTPFGSLPSVPRCWNANWRLSRTQTLRRSIGLF